MSSENTGNIDPRDLGLSESLVHALDEWAREYDRTLDRNDPAASGFRTPAELEASDRQGRVLVERLRGELDDRASVAYVSELEMCERSSRS